ncbi:nucleotidyltransferase domain-containing protein [Porphyromonas gulae]|uniref:cGAS/DncV-like nucleotidyltransferase C-terminal helical domain-containing protein n=1 Tax=Porphyromonas gulae TaxID=111105 RepID=A0A0A2EYX1_9PORP|nr:nucleotidyltransferase domain-containing protein [Porphyromonas gulae]KGN84086.1 hypothetical protein HR08_09440 [Porphyromonas gulae]
MDYKSKLITLSNRYNPERVSLFEARHFSNSGLLSTDRDVVQYVKKAMCAVDEDYTQKTKQAGEAAKGHLERVLRDVSFEYQGSVMTDTHIKGASDIDLLVLCNKFYDTEITKVRKEIQSPSLNYTPQEVYRLSRYNQCFSEYQGNSYADLANLRADIERTMKYIYDECDTSHAKAVKIRNKHLHRDVDIVTASWFQSLNYVLHDMPKEELGIKIYNKDKGYAEGPDYPFMSISKINSRSADTNGRLKRMIRFLKNVRTDSEQEIPLTSFDINAICYSIPVRDYIYLDYKGLVHILWSTMFYLWHDHQEGQLKSVVGDEYVFQGKPEKVEALKMLEDEVYKIKTDLEKV